MTISDYWLKGQVNKYQGAVSRLQRDARTLFYDSIMGEVNDSLASILAVCDNEGKAGIPKIKQYIQKINQSLNSAKQLQGVSLSGDHHYFDLSFTLKNIIRVLRGGYKELNLKCDIPDLHSLVSGTLDAFENFFFHSLIHLFKIEEGEVELEMEMQQKNQEAVIFIRKISESVSTIDREKIDRIKQESHFNGMVQISNKKEGVELMIKLPLKVSLVSFKKEEGKNGILKYR